MREIVYKDLKVGDEVVTRDGLIGRVICTDASGEYPIVCLIDNDGDESADFYTSNGRFSLDDDRTPFDIFLPPKKEYVIIYRKTNGAYGATHYHNKKTADRDIEEVDRNFTYIKTIEVEI